MKTLLLGGLLLLGTSGVAIAQEAPNFFAETYPEHALESALEARSTLANDQAALDAKTRELIALAVAAQIPCEYCIYAHRQGGLANGASDAEVREAIAAAAQVRHWSTVLNGMEYDFETFKSEFDEMMGMQEE